MQEILAEKKRKEDAYRIEKLAQMKKVKNDCKKRNYNKNNQADKKKKDGRRGSFVLRKEKLDVDDNSESDMDVSGMG